MYYKRIKKSIVLGAVILIATGAIAFAHMGDGYGGYGMGPGMMGYGGYGGYGMGPGMMGYGGYGGPMMGYGPGPDRGYNANLSDEQRAKLDAAREAFFNDTRQLRDQIQEKRYSLNTELNKENPDTAKIAQVQKELSELDSEFDQKSIAYQLEMRKLLPENDLRAGFGSGFGNGYCR
jgi:Spy/CpxP family protein refolding chaperone